MAVTFHVLYPYGNAKRTLVRNFGQNKEGSLGTVMCLLMVNLMLLSSIRCYRRQKQIWLEEEIHLWHP